MPDGLYEHDALAWSEQQADLLRRLASGERLNEAVDWVHVIEEVADVGLSELRTCRSLLRQAMTHLVKLHMSPDALSADHWRSEVAGFLADARDRFSPSMRHRLDLDALFRTTLYNLFGSRIRRDDGGHAGKALPSSETCPFTLDQLLAEDPDITALVGRLGDGDVTPS